MKNKKRIAFLMALALVFTALFQNAPSIQASAAARNSITKLEIGNIPEGKSITLEDGCYYNFDPKIASKQKKGKTTDIVWWEVDSASNGVFASSSRWGYVYPVCTGEFKIRAISFASTTELNQWRAARKANGNIADESINQKYATAWSDWEEITVTGDETVAVVRTQSQLNFARKNKKIKEIHIATEKEKSLTIPSKYYEKKTLVVNSPKADVTNSGRFAEIVIEQVGEKGFVEKTSGNKILVTSSSAYIKLDNKVTLNKLEVNSKSDASNVNIEINGGYIKNTVITSCSNISIYGQTAVKLPISIMETANGITLSTEVDSRIKVHSNADIVSLKEDANIIVDIIKEADVTFSGSESTIKVNVSEEAEGSEITLNSKQSITVDADSEVTVAFSGESKDSSIIILGDGNVTVKNNTEGIISRKDSDGKVIDTIQPGSETEKTEATPSVTPSTTLMPTAAPNPPYVPNPPIITPPGPTATPTPSVTPTPDPGRSAKGLFLYNPADDDTPLPDYALIRSYKIQINGNDYEGVINYYRNIITVAVTSSAERVNVVLTPTVELLNEEVQFDIDTEKEKECILDLQNGYNELSYSVTAQEPNGIEETYQVNITVLRDHAMDWKDDNLEEAMREITQIYDRDIMLNDVIRLYFLNIHGWNIQNIDALGELKNLTNLSLMSNNVTDISALGKLDKLLELWIGWNGLEDTTPFAEMQSLEKLHLNDNNVSNIYPLSELTNLIYLDLSKNTINDISPLSKLITLEYLDITDNKVTNIYPIEKLCNLTTLYIGINEIKDITPVQNLTKLSNLDIGVTNVAEIKPIKNLNNLKYLTIIGDEIQDIDIIYEMNQLEQLFASNSNINIDKLGNLTNLTWLMLDKNNITDISVVSKMTNLKYLYLSNNQISDIKPIKNLKNLTNLHLSYNNIEDISALKELKELDTLMLSSNNIKSIENLSELIKMTFLTLSDNQITDVSPLSNLTELDYLYLDGNPIEDYSPVEFVPNLRK